jgi:hypothetical protein
MRGWEGDTETREPERLDEELGGQAVRAITGRFSLVISVCHFPFSILHRRINQRIKPLLKWKMRNDKWKMTNEKTTTTTLTT